jgi:hypothetical protein
VRTTPGVHGLREEEHQHDREQEQASSEAGHATVIMNEAKATKTLPASQVFRKDIVPNHELKERPPVAYSLRTVAAASAAHDDDDEGREQRFRRSR